MDWLNCADAEIARRAAEKSSFLRGLFGALGKALPGEETSPLTCHSVSPDETPVSGLPRQPLKGKTGPTVAEPPRRER